MSGLQRMEAAQDGMEASYEMQVGGGRWWSGLSISVPTVLS